MLKKHTKELTCLVDLMANIYTNSKVNPITGTVTDNNPRQEARQAKRQVRREDRSLNKSLNEGIKKQKVDKSIKTISYKGTPVEQASKQKDWRDKVKPDKGGKKNMSLGVNRSKLNIDKAGQKKQDTDCKVKRGMTSCKKTKPVQNVMWTISK